MMQQLGSSSSSKSLRYGSGGALRVSRPMVGRD